MDPMSPGVLWVGCGANMESRGVADQCPHRCPAPLSSPGLFVFRSGGGLFPPTEVGVVARLSQIWAPSGSTGQ